MTVSALQLDGFVLDQLSVTANEDYDEDSGTDSVELTLQAAPLVNNDDASEHQLILSVGFSPVEGKSCRYSGNVAGRAYFRTDQDLTDDEVGQYVFVNGSAILYGLLRGQVATVTACARWGMFLLPAANLVDAFVGGIEASEPVKKPKKGGRKATAAPSATKAPRRGKKAST